MKGFIFNESKEILSDPCILFMDYNGWWAPLTSLYYSTSSHVLVSKHPESSIEEIISYYCPQCLDPYSEADVQLYRNRCPSCFQCPVCDSPLAVVALDASNSCFQCRMCCWRSDGCNITGSDESEVASLVLEKERDDLAGEAFQALYSSYVTAETQQRFENDPSARLPRYTWDDMNAKMETNKSLPLLDPRDESGLYTYMKAANLFNQTLLDEDEETILKTSSLSSLVPLRVRLNRDNHGQSPLVDILPPKRVRFRTKKMIRCRKDVRDNKMSILIQPKSFPLEGDSSHNLHKGKWWTKDSSAVHEIPQVSILGARNLTFRQLAAGEVAFLHISIANYKVNDILLSIGLSSLESSISTLSLGEMFLNVNQSEPHQPFAFKSLPLIASSELEQTFQQIKLTAYEDELLRDDVDDKNFPEYAPEIPNPDSLEWGLSIQHNIAKICIPLKLSAHQIEESNNLKSHGELFFKLCCMDITEDDPKELNLIQEKSITTFFRIVLPLQ